MSSKVETEDFVGQAFASACARDSGLVLFSEGEQPSHAALGAYADRVVFVPMADRAVLGVALGMAVAGQASVIELASRRQLPRLLGLLQQVHDRHPSSFKASVVLRVPPGMDADPPIWHLCGAWARVQTVVASDARACGVWLERALEQPGLTLLWETDPTGPSLESVPVEGARFAREVRAGTQATVFALGEGVGVAAQAIDQLATEGASVELIDVVSLSQADASALAVRVARTGRLVVVAPAREHAWANGLRSLALDTPFLYLEAPVTCSRPDVESVVSALRTALMF